jgi:geranylgeranyl reductase family protein
VDPAVAATSPADAAVDVLVAGAGPAGAVAARTLAAAGLRTVLVDRATFPRNKPCGGGISVRALVRFPWLEPALAGVDVHRIGTLHLEGPDGTALDVESHAPSVLLVRRVEFDHALVRAAIAAGAELLEGFEIAQASQDEGGVTVQARDGRRLRAARAVAADSVHSVMAKRLGVNPRWPESRLAIDMMEETPVTTLAAARPDVLWVAYAYGGLDGYAYIFPKTRHVNVGIGCLLSHYKTHVAPGAASGDRAGRRPYDLQARFIDALVARGELTGRSDPDGFTPFLIPVGGPLDRAWSGRVLFAGDAGGFVNAFTAEGIYYAMVSGELAGKAVVATDRAWPDETGAAYERAWRDELGTELDDAVAIQRYLFGQHDRVARALRAGRTARPLIDLALRFVRGELTYGALRRRLMMRAAGLWVFGR